MFCGNCGFKNADGAIFCASCGASLNTSSAEPAQTVSKNEGVALNEDATNNTFGFGVPGDDFGVQPIKEAPNESQTFDDGSDNAEEQNASCEDETNISDNQDAANIGDNQDETITQPDLCEVITQVPPRKKHFHKGWLYGGIPALLFIIAIAVFCIISFPGDIDFKSEKGVISVCKNGAGIPFDEATAKEILLQSEIEILVSLNDGEYSSTAWGCDLTYDYVKINGDYRT